MKTHSSYTAYFQEIARRHKLIRHTETEKHFARIVLSVDEFGQNNLGEFITGIRNKLRTPALLLVAYDHTYNDNKGDQLRKENAGAFILLDLHKEDFNYQEDTYDKLETIGEQIIAFMIEDFKQNLQDRTLTINQLGGEKIGKVDNFLGMRFAFSYSININGPLHHKPENWLE